MLLSAWEKGHVNATINNVKACFVNNCVYEWVIEDEVASRQKDMQTSTKSKRAKKSKVQISKKEDQLALI
jgi:hypothetical protein